MILFNFPTYMGTSKEATNEGRKGKVDPERTKLLIILCLLKILAIQIVVHFTSQFWPLLKWATFFRVADSWEQIFSCNKNTRQFYGRKIKQNPMYVVIFCLFLFSPVMSLLTKPDCLMVKMLRKMLMKLTPGADAIK